MDTLNAKKLDRFRFLNALYERTGGSSGAYVSMYELGTQIGFERQNTANVVEYLVGEHLVAHMAMGGIIGITHHGVVEVERALTEPEKPTQYFPPVVNVMHVHTMINSQVQQGSDGSSQSQTVSQNDLASLKEFLEAFGAAVAGSPASLDTRAELEAEIATLKAQMSSPKPKRNILAASLGSLKTILLAETVKSLASEFVQKITHLIAGVGRGSM